MRVKICGLTAAADVAAAAAAGADLVGFVVFPPSPRGVTVEQAAALARAVPAGVERVVLTVDAGDDLLAAIVAAVPCDLLQLHGRETPARVAEVRARFGLPVMKAVGLAGPGDLGELALQEAVADRLLVDARPPPGATRPGGNGLTFDWRLLQGRAWARPWMLAGGLTPANAGVAVRLTGAPALDVSSGVEAAPGRKDAHRVRAFIAAARAAWDAP